MNQAQPANKKDKAVYQSIADNYHKSGISPELVKDIETGFVKLKLASCTCVTKTPDYSFHEQGCRYRVVCETEALVMKALEECQ